MRSVVLCGSHRFKPELREFGEKLKELGVIVFEPYLHFTQEDWNNLSDDYKKFVALGLTYDHFQKIKQADVVFIFNKNGYSGNSVTLEIGCAVALGKTIYALSSEDPELCRHVLFREIIKTPEELIKKL